MLVEDSPPPATSRPSSVSCARRGSQPSPSSRSSAAGACSAGSCCTATRRSAGATATCCSRANDREPPRVGHRAGHAQQALHASSERLALLLEATEQLTQTLDYEELLRRVPQLVVPRIADGCHVYIARNETELVRVAQAHVEPRIAALLEKSTPSTTSRATSGSRSCRSSAPASPFTGRRCPGR